MTYVIDGKDKDKDWAGEIGQINKELIKRVVPFTPKDGKDVLFYVCGPPAFMKAISGDKAKVTQHTRTHFLTAHALWVQHHYNHYNRRRRRQLLPHSNSS